MIGQFRRSASLHIGSAYAVVSRSSASILSLQTLGLPSSSFYLSSTNFPCSCSFFVLFLLKTDPFSHPTMLAHLSFLTVVLITAYLFHRYQLVSDHLLPFIRTHYPRFNQYSPLNTFEDQRNAGLSSSNFDLESNNMAVGDSRQGLDAAGSAEVQQIMREEGLSFDEARLRRHQRLLARNNVDPSGMPLDSKAITRL